MQIDIDYASLKERPDFIKQLYEKNFIPYQIFINNYPDELKKLWTLHDNSLYFLFENDKRVALTSTQAYLFNFLCSRDALEFTKNVEVMSYIKISKHILLNTLSYLEKIGYIKKIFKDGYIYFYCFDETGKILNPIKEF